MRRRSSALTSVDAKRLVRRGRVLGLRSSLSSSSSDGSDEALLGSLSGLLRRRLRLSGSPSAKLSGSVAVVVEDGPESTLLLARVLAVASLNEPANELRTEEGGVGTKE